MFLPDHSISMPIAAKQNPTNCRTVKDEAIALLKTGQVEEISLDHDLGNDERGTGYDVILWIEEAVVTKGFTPPKIRVHSANSSARIKMESGIASIIRLSSHL